MKKLLLLLMVFVGCLQASADYHFTFKSANTDGNSAATVNTQASTILSEGTEYFDKITATEKAFYNSKGGMKLGSSAAGSLDFTVKTAGQVNTKLIKITETKYGSDTSTLELYINGTKVTTITPSATETTHDVTLTAPVKIESIKIASTGKRVYVKSIEVIEYVEGGNEGGETGDKTATTLAWASTAETATVGDAFTLPALTLTPDVDGFMNAVTYSMTGDNVGTLSGNVLTLTAAGTATITATYAGNDTYAASTTTTPLTLTVSGGTVTPPSGSTDEWTLVKNLSELTEANTVFAIAFADKSKVVSAHKTSDFDNADVTITNGKFKSENVLEFTVEKGTDCYYWKNPEGKYLSLANKASGITFTDANNSNDNKISVEIDSKTNYNATIGSVTSLPTSGTKRSIAIQTTTSSTLIRMYDITNSDYTKPQIYKRLTTPPMPQLGLYFDPSHMGPYELEEMPSADQYVFESPKLKWSADIGSAEPYFEFKSSNPKVATVDQNGVVTIVGEEIGSTYITASFSAAGFDDVIYDNETCYYMITIKEHARKALDMGWGQDSFTCRKGDAVETPEFRFGQDVSFDINAVKFDVTGDEGVVSVEQNGSLCLIGGIGSATVRATTERTYEYNSGAATITVTVKEAKANGWYKVESIDDLTDGSLVILAGANNYVASTVNKANNRDAALATIEDDELTQPHDALIFALEAQENGKWALKTVNYRGTQGYLAANGDDNRALVHANLDDDAIATIAINDDATATITYNAYSKKNETYVVNVLMHNMTSTLSTNIFNGYTTDKTDEQYHPVSLYTWIGTDIPFDNISYAAAKGSVEYNNKGVHLETLTVPEFANPDALDVKWLSTSENVAVDPATGDITTVISTGKDYTAYVVAYTEGSKTTRAAEAYYIINVKAGLNEHEMDEDETMGGVNFVKNEELGANVIQLDIFFKDEDFSTTKTKGYRLMHNGVQLDYLPAVETEGYETHYYDTPLEGMGTYGYLGYTYFDVTKGTKVQIVPEEETGDQKPIEIDLADDLHYSVWNNIFEYHDGEDHSFWYNEYEEDTKTNVHADITLVAEINSQNYICSGLKVHEATFSHADYDYIFEPLNDENGENNGFYHLVIKDFLTDIPVTDEGKTDKNGNTIKTLGLTDAHIAAAKPISFHIVGEFPIAVIDDAIAPAAIRTLAEGDEEGEPAVTPAPAYKIVTYTSEPSGEAIEPTLSANMSVSGVHGVTVDGLDAAAPVEYYNLQGVRIANPTTGLYIRRQGTQVQKIAL